MLDSLFNFADQLLRNLRVADVADMLLAAVLIYCALLWFGETTSRRMLVGVTLLGLVYLGARMFEMHLTSLAFHTGFTVLLLLLIVVFQEDLRRMFSRAASWISLSPRSSHSSSVVRPRRAQFCVSRPKDRRPDLCALHRTAGASSQRRRATRWRGQPRIVAVHFRS